MSEKSGFEELMSQVDGFIFHPLTLGFVGFGVFCRLLVFAMSGTISTKTKFYKFSDTWWLNALGWFAIFFAPILAIIFVSILAMLKKVGGQILTDDTTGLLGQDNLRWYVLAYVGLLTALGGVISTPLALIRVYTTERQTKTAEHASRVAEQTFAADVIARAAKNLMETKPVNGEEGITEEPAIEVRTLGILAMEKLAQENPDYHIQVIEILSGYIRESLPMMYGPTMGDALDIPKIRSDIQTAISVIGRRGSAQKSLEANINYRIDLSGINLSGVNFSKLDFSAANFQASRIERANFRGATLIGTNFSQAQLNHTQFHDADLTGALMDRVEISIDAPFQVLSLPHANTFGVSLRGANISGINYFASNNIADLFGNADTKMGEPLQEKWDEVRKDVDLYQSYTLTERLENSEEALQRLKDAEGDQFKEWCAFGDNDMANGIFYADFARKRNLVGWPFWLEPSVEQD